MIKKLSVIILIFTLLGWTNACTPCDCKQYRAKSDKFKVDTVSTSFFRLEIREDSNFNYTQHEGDSLEENKVVVSIQMNLSMAQLPKPKCFHFTNTAYACSCAENIFKATDPVTKLEIFTRNDFDANHLAGSDITEYFVHLEMGYNPAQIIKKSITDETISWLNKAYGGLQPQSTGAMLYLNQAPVLDKNLGLKIVLTFESGAQHELNTNSLYLTP